MYEPVRRPRRTQKNPLRSAILADPTHVPRRLDPVQRRMKGIAPHGNTPFDVPVISQIAPNLWQGGTLTGLIMPAFIDHVVTLYTTQQYTFIKDVTSMLTFKLTDKEDQDLSQIDTIARWINECRKTGVVLVHCSAGLNRSSVVVARALMLEGINAQEAIGLIRQKRSPACLCNKAFESWLISL